MQATSRFKVLQTGLSSCKSPKNKILYSIPYLSDSAATASSGGGGGDGGFILHGLIVAAFFACVVALVSVSLALWKWRKVQRFKVLDNNGELHAF